MPIYEYKCRMCDARFEALRPMREGHEPARCPACGAMETSRLLSVFAAQRSADSSGGECGWDAAAGACFKGG
jgi:putative FmdB family regulatory protein